MPPGPHRPSGPHRPNGPDSNRPRLAAPLHTTSRPAASQFVLTDPQDYLDEENDVRQPADELLRQLQSIVGRRGKKRHAMNPFMKFARWTARSEYPFVNFYRVLTFGLHENLRRRGSAAADADLNMSAEEADICQNIWNKMTIFIPSILGRINVFASNLDLLGDLGKQMTRAAGSARSDDIRSLKMKGLEYIAAVLPGGKIEPPIMASASKEATRGWVHPQLRELLLPIKYRPRYEDNPEATIEEIKNGNLPVRAYMLPSFLYKNCQSNRENIRSGLFENPLVLLVYKHIFTSPSSAETEGVKLTKTRGSQAKMHDLNEVTPETLAYAILQTHYMLWGVDDWRSKQGTFDKIQFFRSCVKFLSSNDDWIKATLARLTRKVFSAAASEDEEEEIDEDDNDFELFFKQRNPTRYDFGDGLDDEEVNRAGRNDVAVESDEELNRAGVKDVGVESDEESAGSQEEGAEQNRNEVHEISDSEEAEEEDHLSARSGAASARVTAEIVLVSPSVEPVAASPEPEEIAPYPSPRTQRLTLSASHPHVEQDNIETVKKKQRKGKKNKESSAATRVLPSRLRKRNYSNALGDEDTPVPPRMRPRVL